MTLVLCLAKMAVQYASVIYKKIFDKKSLNAVN